MHFQPDLKQFQIEYEHSSWVLELVFLLSKNTKIRPQYLIVWIKLGEITKGWTLHLKQFKSELAFDKLVFAFGTIAI